MIKKEDAAITTKISSKMPSAGKSRFNKVVVMSLALILTFSVWTSLSSIPREVYGHGLGTDEAPEIEVEERRVAVEAEMSPAFIENLGTIKPTLMVRTFDKANNGTISGIDYKIAVEYKGELLLDQRFRSSDGVFYANLVPDSEALSPTINGNGQSANQIPVSLGQPVEVRSKIFADGGLYEIIITLEGASPGLALGEDRTFNLFISVAKSYPFEVETESGETKQVEVISYYDQIENFSYNSTSKTMSFAMPFSWDIDYVNQVSTLHIEFDFPKSMEEFQSNGYTGTVNGFDLPPNAVLIDDYSSEEKRIVHIVVNTPKLDELSRKIKQDRDVAIFTMQPIDKPKFPLDITTASEKYLLQISWDPAIIESGTPTTFVMNLQDPATGDLLRSSSFDFTLIQNGQEIHRQFLRSDLGTYSYQFTFAHNQIGLMTLRAANINGEGEDAEIDLIVVRGTGEATPGAPTDSSPNNSGCLIATAAFGSELAPQVQYLRNFRDNYVLSTVAGSAFMNSFNAAYYSFSPSVADYERENPWLQNTVKVSLYPLFGILYVSERAFAEMHGGEAGVILAGTIASALIGAVYLSPVTMAIPKLRRIKFSPVIPIAILASTGMAILAAMLLGNQTFLSIATSAFVISVAGISALTIPKIARILYYKIK